MEKKPTKPGSDSQKTIGIYVVFSLLGGYEIYYNDSFFKRAGDISSQQE